MPSVSESGRVGVQVTFQTRGSEMSVYGTECRFVFVFVYLLLAFLQNECETGCNKLYAYKIADRKRKSETAVAKSWVKH